MARKSFGRKFKRFLRALFGVSSKKAPQKKAVPHHNVSQRSSLGIREYKKAA